jgi:hypothetical protein
MVKTMVGIFVKLNSGAHVYVTSENENKFSGINIESLKLEERPYHTKNIIDKNPSITDIKHRLKHKPYSNTVAKEGLIQAARDLEQSSGNTLVSPRKKHKSKREQNHKRNSKGKARIKNMCATH